MDFNLTWQNYQNGLSEAVDLDLYIYNQGDDFFSYDSYVARGYSRSTQNEIMSFPLPSGDYYIRVDLHSHVIEPVDFNLMIATNGVENREQGKVYNHKFYREQYPTIFQLNTDMISQTGYCRINLSYSGPSASLRLYPYGEIPLAREIRHITYTNIESIILEDLILARDGAWTFMFLTNCSSAS